MRTDRLIATLARDLAPVTPYPRPAIRTGVWLALGPVFLAAGVAVWGVRDDIASAAGDRVQLTIVMIAVLTMASAAFGALLLSVPGARGAGAAMAVPVAALLLWAAVLVARIAADGGSLQEALTWPYAVCLIKVATISSIPGAVLSVMLRGAPVRTARIAVLAAIAAGSLGAVGAQIACPNDTAAHALAGHLAPVMALALVAGRLGPAFIGRTMKPLA